MPLNWVDAFFPIIYMFISYLFFLFKLFIFLIVVLLLYTLCCLWLSCAGMVPIDYTCPYLACILGDITRPVIILPSILFLGIISSFEDVSKFTTEMLYVSFIFPIIFALCTWIFFSLYLIICSENSHLNW